MTFLFSLSLTVYFRANSTISIKEYLCVGVCLCVFFPFIFILTLQPIREIYFQGEITESNFTETPLQTNHPQDNYPNCFSFLAMQHGLMF